jgi:uncharacterized protein (TIGR02996 family)
MFADEALPRALLEACRQEPDDDAPRLVWADAVGGERGEFVVIQCDLARGGLAPAQAAAWRRRERELRATYGREWAGLDAFACLFEFRRGFVEAIKLDAGLLMDRREAFLLRAPLLRSVTVTGLTGALDKLRGLLDSSAFFRLHGLDLCGIEAETGESTELGDIYEPNSDEAARVLVESGALGRLGALGISESRLSAAGVRYLATSGDLHRLERLWLHQRFGYDEVFAALFHASQMESLGESLAEVVGMGYSSGAFGSLQTLPPVTELHLSRIDDHALATLGDSRAAATVETLWLSGTLTGFRAFPRLHTLDFMGQGLSIGGVQLGDLEGMRGVDSLPSLRRLRIPYYESESVLRVARTWGPQLEELTLWGKPAPSVLEQLQEYVAGEVRWSAKREVHARLL